MALSILLFNPERQFKKTCFISGMMHYDKRRRSFWNSLKKCPYILKFIFFSHMRSKLFCHSQKDKENLKLQGRRPPRVHNI